MFKSYLSASSSSRRQEILHEMKKDGETVSLSYINDLCLLSLPVLEKQLLIQNADKSDPLAFESLLVQLIGGDDQNLACSCMHIWAKQTGGLLWYQLMSLWNRTFLPQRLKYVMVEYSHLLDRDAVLEFASQDQQILEMSPSYHSLLFYQGVLSGTAQVQLRVLLDHYLATETVTTQTGEDYRSNITKALPNALLWALRYDSSAAESFCGRNLPLHLRGLCDITHFQISQPIKPLSSDVDRILQEWPPIWQRHQISAAELGIVLALPESSLMGILPYLRGVDPTALEQAASTVGTKDNWPTLLSNLSALIRRPFREPIIDHTQQLAQKLQGGERDKFIKKLPSRLQVAIDPTDSRWLDIVQHEQQARGGGFGVRRWPSYVTVSSQDGDGKMRGRFFDVIYRHGDAAGPSAGSTDWELLLDLSQNPDGAKLPSAIEAGRRLKPVFAECAVKMLGHQKGSDQATVAALELTQSFDQKLLSQVVVALSSIGTPKAIQEMIYLLTKFNSSFETKMLLCEQLIHHDLSGFESELRSVYNDIQVSEHNFEEKVHLREQISRLIPSVHEELSEADEAVVYGTTGDGQLDEKLTQKIAAYSRCSSQVRRSLRTAQLFEDQMKNHPQRDLVDLSPIVDMQYKALELLYRELFHDWCLQQLKSGDLQRRLDLIGYLRPVPRAMQAFESYLSRQSIIDEIPFFSKYKLRKILRGIAGHTPDKRFTLDGLKAFGMFFLVFGRRHCEFGLNVFDLGFKNDDALKAFVRELHLFQDLRNRAAHEGVKPDSGSDPQTIWQKTSGLISCAYSIFDDAIGRSH